MSDGTLDTLLLNEGTIRVSEGGFGVLIAGAIENRGVVIAPAGKIVLAGCNAIELKISSNRLISLAIEEKVASEIKDVFGNPITEQIKNTGTLEAASVLLDAESLPGIFEKAINLDGIVRATRIETREGGDVRLVADERMDPPGDVTVDIVPDMRGELLDQMTIIETDDLVKIQPPGADEDASVRAQDMDLEIPRGDINTTPGVIIPGSQVKFSGHRTGAPDTPAGVNANLTYIRKIQKAIDISEMWGCGTTICIRGPAPLPGPLGAVDYAAGGDLDLEACMDRASGQGPSCFIGISLGRI